MKSLTIAIFCANPVTAGTHPALESICRLLRGLSRIGHRLTFYHPDALGRRALWKSRDDETLRTIHYPTYGYVNLFECLEEAATADAILKVSGQGPFDQLLDRAVLEVRKPGGVAAILDLEPHATLNRLRQEPNDSFLGLIPEYDFILTTGGGAPLISAFLALGARECHLLWSTLNPVTRQLVPPEPHALRQGVPSTVTLDHVAALEYVLGRSLAARGESRAGLPAPVASAG